MSNHSTTTSESETTIESGRGNASGSGNEKSSCSGGGGRAVSGKGRDKSPSPSASSTESESVKAKKAFLHSRSDNSGTGVIGPKKSKQCVLVKNLNPLPNETPTLGVSRVYKTPDEDQRRLEESVSNSRKQSREARSVLDGLTYPCVIPNFRFNSDYERCFKYIGHIEANKVRVQCTLSKPRIIIPKLTQPTQRRHSGEKGEATMDLDDQIETGALTDDEEMIALCDQVLNIDATNYGNLRRHLKNVHKTEINKAVSSSEYSPGFGRSYGRHHSKQQNFDEAVLFMMSEGLPFQFIERQSFLSLIRLLDSRIKVKTRRTYVKQLKSYSDSVARKGFKVLLGQIMGNNSIHFTIDIWSSKSRNQVLGVKVHFINDEWNLVVRTIGLVEFNDAHTAANIEQKFQSVLDKNNIKRHQVGVVVSDNASNMKKAFDMVEILRNLEEFDLESDEDDEEPTDTNVAYAQGQRFIIDGDEFESDTEVDNEDAVSIADSTADIQSGLGWSGCLAHTVQLAINESIKSDEAISELIMVANKVIRFFKASPKWLNIYRIDVQDSCDCEKKTTTHELHLPNTTRWNSTLFAIEKLSIPHVFKTVQQVLRNVTNESKTVRKTSPGLLTGSYQEQLAELAKLLKPLAVLTNVLQADSNTCSIVIVSVVTAFRGILQLDAKTFATFKEALLENLVKRLQPALFRPWFVIGAVLDPRQKVKLFKGFGWQRDQPLLKLPSISFVEECITREILRDNLQEDSEYGKRNQANAHSSSSQTNKSGLFSVLDEMEDDPVEEKGLLDEFKRFCSEPREGEDINPLQFWKDNASKYPTLAPIAKRILSVPASSGSVERLFSIAGSIGRARRARISISKVEDLIFVRESKIIS